MGRGAVNAVPLYPREIVKRALELGASGLNFVHNHPCSVPVPNRDDLAVTKSVIKAARHLDLSFAILSFSGHRDTPASGRSA